MSATVYTPVGVDQFVVDEAIELTGRHRLRGYDAIHLACALRLNRALNGFGMASLNLSQRMRISWRRHEARGFRSRIPIFTRHNKATGSRGR